MNIRHVKITYKYKTVFILHMYFSKFYIRTVWPAFP